MAPSAASAASTRRRIGYDSMSGRSSATGAWARKLRFSNGPDGRVAYRFHARDVNLVMGPVKPGSTLRFRVLVDGKAPGANHGGDVDANGYGTVSRQDTYQLIRQRKPIVDRLFEIEFLEPGVEALDFTFG